MIFSIIALVICSYLLGSIPTAWILGRLQGIDILSSGSKSSGATNALRVLGKKSAIVVLSIDFIKGLAAVLALAPLLLQEKSDTGRVIAAVSCMAGHIHSIWLGFKGGKGVATGAAVSFALAPLAAIPSLLIFILVVRLSKFVSLASMSAALLLPLSYAMFYHGKSMSILLFFIGSAALVLFSHRKNIGRLRRGTEPKLGQ
ncbi:glycerol-3-phosphate 1-O-acyltransferase PlsY [Treponema sp.]